MMKYYTTVCEVWVRPLFGKSRPKRKTLAFAAHNLNQLYELIREEYSGKRYKLLHWAEIQTVPDATSVDAECAGK